VARLFVSLGVALLGIGLAILAEEQEALVQVLGQHLEDDRRHNEVLPCPACGAAPSCQERDPATPSPISIVAARGG
jgi:hypothetical protein